MGADDIVDRVPMDSPGIREVDFHVPDRYNASEVLFHNLAAGRGDKVAVRSPVGDATYGELCASACRAGNALRGQGLPDFGRVLLVLDDTPVYPAAVFGAIRAGYVPVLVNTLSTADLVGYYLADSEAEIAVVESGLCALFAGDTTRGSRLRRLVVVNGPPPAGLPVEAVAWDDWLADGELEPAPTHRDDVAFWMYSSGSTDRPKGIVHLQHDMAFTQRSYGKRVPGYEVELVDANGAPVAAGEPGVLRVRGASSAPCYWNQPTKTAETMRDGWIHTGDRFRVDGDGFHYFLGRTDDLIKVSGQWVYPLEVEHCLSEHPAVLECAVMGVSLADRRTTLKAFVVVAAGHRAGAPLSRELKDYVKAELMAYKYPRTIEYLAGLPKTGTGKIDRQKLLARIKE